MSSLENYLEFASGPPVASRIENQIDDYKKIVAGKTDQSIQELMQRKGPAIQSSNVLQNTLASAKNENQRLQKTIQDQTELSADWQKKQDERKAAILKTEEELPSKEQQLRDLEQTLRNQHTYFNYAEHFIQRCTNNILMNDPMQEKLSQQAELDRPVEEFIKEALGGPK